MQNSLIDKELLGKLQKHFYKANNIYLACMDREGNRLTSDCCTEEEIQYISQFISKKNVQSVFDCAYTSQVETILEETLEQSYIKFCAAVSRRKDAVVFLWVVAAVIEEFIPEDTKVPEGIVRTSENGFYRSLAFLEMLSKDILLMKEQAVNIEEALVQTTEAEEKLKEQFSRSDAMVRVVGEVASEEEVSGIAIKSLREVCQALHLQGGCIVRMRPDRKTVETYSEYCQEESWSLGQKIHGKSIEELPFFNGKSYMISSDSMMPAKLETFFIKYHLTAGIFMPMKIKNHRDMYLCFYEFEKSRIWSLEDIKFINDVKRILHSIVEQRLSRKSLADSYVSMKTVLEHTACAVYVADYEKKEFVYINETFRKIIAKGMTQAEVEKFFFQKNEMRGEFSSREIELDKNKKWLDMTQTRLIWLDGRKVVLGTVFDITDKKRYQQNIENQISKDHLTGLYNRMRCEQDLEHYIKDAEKRGSEGAFLLIDMDDFQNINYGLGHQYGDALLKSIAHNLVRVSGIQENCYRINGDEFAVIVHGDSYRELSRICKDLRELFERPWFLKNEDYYCTMSMGVVCFPTDGNSADDLNRKVNIALSTAKKKGKNCVEFYNDKVEDTSYYRLDLEQNMRRATLNSCNEFQIYYQPILQMKKEGDICCGAEALVRWNSTELGFIPPNDFIPLAEYLGLINPIGEHVLNEAVKRCKYWNDCGYEKFKVNVNLSVVQLLQPDFVTKVKAILDKNHVNPQNVILEVTENLAINDMNRMKKVLGKLKTLGVHIALDDFGTGYSSLNHIRQMPIDIIKIDQCFIENLAEDEFAEAFVKMISELAKTIGVKICAEGVEEKTQLEILREMHIDMVQGYYYGKPMPAEEFEKFLKNVLTIE